jgi:hypothetical protein
MQASAAIGFFKAGAAYGVNRPDMSNRLTE